jgi:glutathione S-transferase
MTLSGDKPTDRLELRRVFAAARDRVFEAWTTREQLEQWMCRVTRQNVIEYVEFDLRPGGHYVLKNHTAAGEIFLNRGGYSIVNRPGRLVHSWAWEQFDSSGQKTGELGETLVSVTFLESGDATKVALVHEGFPDATMRDAHQAGWNACFERLDEYLDVRP